jgi:hypothetical protein
MELSVFRQVLRVACVYQLLLLHACDISVCVSGVNKLITVSLNTDILIRHYVQCV